MRWRPALKNALRGAVYRTGLYSGLHRWRNRRTLTVLMFHRVLPAGDPRLAGAEREFTFTLSGFCRVLHFVQRHYNVIDLQALDDAVATGRRLPPRALLITFDDGWQDTLDHALPALRERGLPAVLFLATEVVELAGARWWQDALVAALAPPGAGLRLWQAAGWAAGEAVPDPEGPLGPALSARLAAWPEAQRRQWLETQAPGVLAAVAQRQMVTRGGLDALDVPGPGVLRVGGHGHSHAPLTRVIDPARELALSLAGAAALPTGSNAMSFPHGAFHDGLVASAHAAGFQWVFTSEPHLVQDLAGPAPPRTLGRIHLPENEWTCQDGCIDFARLASFLFFRERRRTVPLA